MTPRKGPFVALAGLAIAILCMVIAFLLPDAEGGGVTNSVMLCVFGAGVGLTVMLAGLAVVARTGLRVALLGLVTVFLCAALAFLLMLYFDPAWLGTARMPPLVSLLIVALSIGAGQLGFTVMLAGLAMTGVGALRKQRLFRLSVIAVRKKPVFSLVFCLALSLTATPVRADDDAKEDIDRLQGHWRVVSSQVGDEQALEAEFKNRRLTFAGDKLTYEYGNEQQEKREGTIKLDPKTGAFDWTVPLEGGTSLAIYEIKGDTLKIGFGNDGLVRPKRWEISQENVVWLLVLKRESQDAPLPAQGKKPGAIFRVPESYTLDVVLSADGKLLARGAADNIVDLWDVASDKKLHTLKGHTVPLLKVAFSPDGKTVAWGGTEEQDQKITGTAHVWEVQALAASPPRLPAGSSD
jgi:uncharacterized protein (TIGR03067 family)